MNVDGFLQFALAVLSVSTHAKSSATLRLRHRIVVKKVFYRKGYASVALPHLTTASVKRG
jgi:hypothetical protein